MRYATSTLFSQQTSADQSCAIRIAQQRDLANIVIVHQRAFPDSFLTGLGSEFLHQYYGLVLAYPERVLLVSTSQDQVEGFVCGFVDPAEFYKSMSQRKWRFALPVLGALARDPRLAGKIVNGLQRVERKREPLNVQSCELSSLAVLPKSRGKGIGGALVKAFLEQAGLCGTEHVFLCTDADDNDSVNGLYRKAGFQIRQRYPQYKERWMNEYVIDMSQRNG